MLTTFLLRKNRPPYTIKNKSFRYKGMKAIVTIALSLMMSMAHSQIKFSSEEEIEQALEYLNKMRTSKEFVKKETGVVVSHVSGKKLEIDNTLQELAKLRVIEMVEKKDANHDSKYERNYYSECVGYDEIDNHKDLKQHIKLYVIDSGYEDYGYGHRDEMIFLPHDKVGFFSGTINGRTYSCFIFCNSNDWEITPITMK